MKRIWNNIKDIVFSIVIALLSTFGLYALLAVLSN